ncbi:hypothetical protein Taro_015845 [Colocasia esculenta]|uniref:F-box protein At3g26010-like beta-propeller domain-containing protein n=1 Tax=Colocasia esculenta TaxID=4460 RepID=A0A843UIZ5_COLES|nr:hypothetical protein [Colocasia esculenta]
MDEDEHPPAEPAAAAACEVEDVEDLREWLRRRKAERRARLRDRVERILQQARTPLRDVVREHVLPRLPVRSLLRFASVSHEWRHFISVPLFRNTQSYTHRTASGVFCQMLPGVPAYSPFDPLAGGIPDPTLSFLPSYPSVAALASSNGLLCCAGVLHSFYVCNPSTAEWTPLPEPPLPDVVYRDGAPLAEDGGTAVALVFEPSAANLELDYHLVRAFQVSKDCAGVFGFQVFSSETGAWWISSDVCAAESMICGSGVSAGGVAYWRTEMQTVVGYDPAADTCRSVPWPMGYNATVNWQLGEMGGRLCCTCVTDWAVEAYALDAGDSWALLASYRVVEDDDWDNGGDEAGGSTPVFRRWPWPLRFQSGASEVLLCAEGRIVGLDVVSGKMRDAQGAPGQPLMDPSYAIYVPHISTFAPVGRQVWRRRVMGDHRGGYTIANNVAAEQPMGDD